MALRGLVVDWGGVLTADLGEAMSAWAQRDGVPLETFQDVMLSWVGAVPAGASLDAVAADVPAQPAPVPPDPSRVAPGNPVHALERGEMDVATFERLLADELTGRGSPVEPAGLVQRMLAGLAEQAPDMVGLVRRARQAGLRTALLSNSWGNAYPRQEWAGLFDAVVISGEVGMRKPEHRIYRHTADLLGLDPAQCVMVDDLAPNVRAAVEVGMAGVQHRSYPETALDLEAVFGLRLR